MNIPTTFSLVFIVVFVTLFLNCNGTPITIYSEPVTLNNINCLNNNLIYFNNTQIQFNQTDFSISGICTITSLVGLLNIQISTLPTNESTVNKLKLKNIKFSLNEPTTLNNLLIEMNDISSITFNGNFNFNFNKLMVSSGSKIVNGGLISIPSSSSLNLNGSSYYVIDGKVENYGSFQAQGIKIGLKPSEFQAKPGSINNFYEGIQSTTYSFFNNAAGKLVFHNCKVLLSKFLDLNGGTLSLSSTDFQTTPINPQYTFIYDTSIEIFNQTTFTFYRNQQYLLTTFKLRNGSKLKLNQGTESISFKIQTSVNLYSTDRTENFFYSEDGKIDCNGYNRNNNTVSFKSIENGRDLRMTGLTMCSERNIASRLFLTIRWLDAAEIYTCGENHYACLTSASCKPLNESCPGDGSCTGVGSTTPIEVDPYESVPLCWNGGCAAYGYSKCSTPYPSCPSDTPYRCAGKCVVNPSECLDDSSCITKCVDGCYSHIRDCQPFNGCPLYTYQCPNFECVSNASQCSSSSSSGNNRLPFSDRILRSELLIYSGQSEVVTLLIRDSNTNNLFSTAEIKLKSPNNSQSLFYNTITISPIPDSIGKLVSGSLIKQNFNYYKDLLLSPFTIEFNNGEITQFSDPLVFYFQIPRVTFLNWNICLAYENSQGKWQCTPFNTQFTNNFKGVYVKTNNINSKFALIRR